MGHRRVYRTTGVLAVGVFLALAVSAACAVDALLSTQTKYWAIDGALPAAVWVCLLITSRVGVHVETDGVRIVNAFRTRRLRWDDIERFELAPAGIYPFAAHAVLKDGSDIPIGGITVPRFATTRLKPRAQEPIEELNALLRSHAMREHSDLAPRAT